jgi:hypothetical protein
MLYTQNKQTNKSHRLEEELSSFKNGASGRADDQFAKALADAQAQASARVQEAEEYQSAAERRLALSNQSLRQAQAEVDRTQSALFESAVEAERRLHALAVENAVLADGTDRANQRMAVLESEAVALRRQLQLQQEQGQEQQQQEEEEEEQDDRGLANPVGQGRQKLAAVETLRTVAAERVVELQRVEVHRYMLYRFIAICISFPFLSFSFLFFFFVFF